MKYIHTYIHIHIYICLINSSLFKLFIEWGLGVYLENLAYHNPPSSIRQFTFIYIQFIRILKIIIL